MLFATILQKAFQELKPLQLSAITANSTSMPS